jgi:hypothetical protein
VKDVIGWIGALLIAVVAVVIFGGFIVSVKDTGFGGGSVLPGILLISQVVHSAPVLHRGQLCRRAGVVKMERPEPAFFCGRGRTILTTPSTGA